MYINRIYIKWCPPLRVVGVVVVVVVVVGSGVVS
jgi:hypothetical protein